MKNANAVISIVNSIIYIILKILNFKIVSTAKYDEIPTGTTVYNSIFTPPLNIVPGYVEKFSIILCSESNIISPFTIQKDVLPAILTTAASIIPPVIEKSVNNRKFCIVAPYINKHIYP